MKLAQLFTLILFLSPIWSNATTLVTRAIILEDAVWDVDTVLINRNLSIPKGSTVWVKDGTRILVAEYVNITIAGGAFKSQGGKYVWKSSGAYHDTIPNAEGCDSILEIDLKKCPPVMASDIPVLKIKIYPNPTTDKLTIDLGSGLSSATVHIRSADGKLIDQLMYKEVEKINMDLSHIPTGVYFLEIEDELHRKENFRMVKLDK